MFYFKPSQEIIENIQNKLFFTCTIIRSKQKENILLPEKDCLIENLSECQNNMIKKRCID